MESARIVIEVIAGMIPGQAIDEFTKRWAITSDEWKHEGLASLLEKDALANAYAAKLKIDAASGMAPNWVRVDWIWL